MKIHPPAYSSILASSGISMKLHFDIQEELECAAWLSFSILLKEFWWSGRKGFRICETDPTRIDLAIHLFDSSRNCLQGTISVNLVNTKYIY